MLDFFFPQKITHTAVAEFTVAAKFLANDAALGDA